MKFYDVIMRIDDATRIRACVDMFGMKFSTEHYGRYFIDNDELMEKQVTDIRVVDGVLEVILA